MSDTNEAGLPPGSKKERSPSFPFIGLTKALERTRAVFANARRHEVRIGDLASSWGIGAKSSGTAQTLAALLAYGLLEDQGAGEGRKFKVTDLAFKALEDQRPGAREAALAEAALKPKLIAEYVEKWKDGRPADGICISELRIDRSFTEDGAKLFLKVFDDTAGFTKGAQPDKQVDITKPSGGQNDVEIGDIPPDSGKSGASKLPPKPPFNSGRPSTKVALMESERELTTGLLAKGSSFRLIVSGAIGVKEIDRLIQKLQIDKEILADQDDVMPMPPGDTEEEPAERAWRTGE
jgi:hypothetical protein